MKNNKKIIFTVIIILIILVILVAFKILNNKKIDNSNEIQNDFINIEVDKNQIGYQENVTIEEIKNDTGAKGNTDIYEIQTEYDGRNVITVKANIKYKVAFAGMIKNSKPELNELDQILNENIPRKNGIWVKEQSRDKILEIFNNENVNSKYTIDNDGYLKIQDKGNQNDIDKKIEGIINGNKQYILDVSSVCYIVDSITGEILDYNFEKMDKYQTYEYFEDEDKFIIFINENTDNQLTKIEIFNSIVGMF